MKKSNIFWEINDSTEPSYLLLIDSYKCHKSGKLWILDYICSIGCAIEDLEATLRLGEKLWKLKINANYPSSGAILLNKNK